MISRSKIFEVYEKGKGRKRSIYTLNLIKGNPVYGENIVFQDGSEFREWNPNKSKLGAAIIKGSPNIGIRKKSSVLYLGAASGTTVSHVSDMVGNEGIVFALDFAPRVLRDLIFVAEKRKNICPIMADANDTSSFKHRITLVDVVFQDIAQKMQAEIFLKNCKCFLKSSGYGILAVKARSIDVTKKPKIVFADIKKKLEKEMTIIDFRTLEPFEKDHCIFICKPKKQR